MKHGIWRIMMLGVTLALMAMLMVSTAALAKGPNEATQARVHSRAGDATQGQLETRTQIQDRVQLHPADGTCPGCSGDGDQIRAGAQVQNGDGFGPGDGTGPIGGGGFGPGPHGQCVDLDDDGICDCKE